MSNSTEVAYNFGQMGSILITGTSNAVTSNEVTADPGVGANAVFCAITFLEDTVFDSAAAGLTPDIAQLYPSSQTGVSSSIDANGGVVTDGVTFPKGLTIYGRWTSILLASGKVIAYVGY
tara:strand:- start:2292 stop:2651 length:360 start_codon:yes stop_codon:yes gene_type:complete